MKRLGDGVARERLGDTRAEVAGVADHGRAAIADAASLHRIRAGTLLERGRWLDAHLGPVVGAEPEHISLLAARAACRRARTDGVDSDPRFNSDIASRAT